MVLTLPYPPSVNSYWRHPSKGPLAGRTLISEEGRAYRTDVIQAMWGPGRAPTLTGRLQVDIEVRMPDKRRRDLDNLPKALLDALTHAGLWADDSQIDDLRIWRSERMGGELVVTVSEMEGALRAIGA